MATEKTFIANKGWDDYEDDGFISRVIDTHAVTETQTDFQTMNEMIRNSSVSYEPPTKEPDLNSRFNKLDAQPKSSGVKYDSGKVQYTLVPPYALEAVAKNLTVGLIKYEERDNWKKVPDAMERYLDALYRHLEKHRMGIIYDEDSADPTTTHMSAVAVNAMFILEFMLNENLKEIKS